MILSFAYVIGRGVALGREQRSMFTRRSLTDLEDHAKIVTAAAFWFLPAIAYHSFVVGIDDGDFLAPAFALCVVGVSTVFLSAVIALSSGYEDLREASQ